MEISNFAICWSYLKFSRFDCAFWEILSVMTPLSFLPCLKKDFYVQLAASQYVIGDAGRLIG